MSKPQATGTIFILGDFTTLDSREDVIHASLTESGSQVIIDLSDVKVAAPQKVFDRIVYYARLVVEHAKRNNRSLPRLVIVPPHKQVDIMQRLKQLWEETGMELEVAASLKGAKAAFDPNTNWKIIQSDN